MEKQEVIIMNIKKLIYKERPNTILAHLRTCFHGNGSHYFGNLRGNKFQIWRSTTQGFHPVISGEVIADEQGEPYVNLKPTLNPFGYLNAVIGTVGITLLVIFMMPAGMNTILSYLITFGTAFLLIAIVHFIYRYETRYNLDQLRQYLKTNSNNTYE